jgi:hypothetical protein
MSAVSGVGVTSWVALWVSDHQEPECGHGESAGQFEGEPGDHSDFGDREQGEDRPDHEHNSYPARELSAEDGDAEQQLSEQQQRPADHLGGLEGRTRGRGSRRLGRGRR